MTSRRLEPGDGDEDAGQPEPQRAARHSGDQVDHRTEELADTAVRLLRGLPRPVRQLELAGFLSVCRAHPQASAAIDYAARKQTQAEYAEQRVEQQFWGQVSERLVDLRPDPEAANEREVRTASRLITAFAQHLVAENLLRLVQGENMHRANAPRRATSPQSEPVARTGGERG